MVYAVQALVGFRNAARRDAVKGNVVARLAQDVPFGVVSVNDTVTRPARDPAFAIEVRFITKPEQQAFWTDVQAAFGSGVNGPVAASSAWTHDCPDDVLGGPACVVDQRIDF